MLIYLHGYASTGGGGKYQAMRDHFTGEIVLSPTLPHDPLEASALAADLVAQVDEPTVVVGTSLGGFYALYLAAVHGVTAVVINPALEPWVSLRAELGFVQRFDSDLSFHWREEHLDKLEQLGRRIAERPDPNELLHLHLARDDELLDHGPVAQRYPEAASLRWWDRTGHRFERFEELLGPIGNVLAGVRSSA
jgi:predicted esterase YcpF (UPF0227 family)